MKEDIQWHQPFRGAMKIELDKYKNILEYVEEKVLTKKPIMYPIRWTLQAEGISKIMITARENNKWMLGQKKSDKIPSCRHFTEG